MISLIELKLEGSLQIKKIISMRCLKNLNNKIKSKNLMCFHMLGKKKMMKR